MEPPQGPREVLETPHSRPQGGPGGGRGVYAPPSPPWGPHRPPDAHNLLAPTHAPLGAQGPQTAVQGHQEAAARPLGSSGGRQGPPQPPGARPPGAWGRLGRLRHRHHRDRAASAPLPRPWQAVPGGWGTGRGASTTRARGFVTPSTSPGAPHRSPSSFATPSQARAHPGQGGGGPVGGPTGRHGTVRGPHGPPPGPETVVQGPCGGMSTPLKASRGPRRGSGRANSVSPPPWGAPIDEDAPPRAPRGVLKAFFSPYSALPRGRPAPPGRRRRRGRTFWAPLYTPTPSPRPL